MTDTGQMSFELHPTPRALLEATPLPVIEQPDQVSGERTIAERFEAFHLRNPAVLDALIRLARGLKRDKWKAAGMKRLFEALRWEHAIRTQGDEYQLNNNYTAYYARLVMAVEPDLKGFFRLRSQRDAWVPDLARLGL